MSITVTISGAAVTVLEQSVNIQDTTDGRSVASFTVKDATGAAKYQPGQPVTIVDSIGSYTYTGYINDTALTNLTPNVTNLIAINCIDGHYIPDKRLYAGPEYQNRYAGDIVVDLIANNLAADGITAAYAVDNDQSLSAWAMGTLTNVVASNNVSGGDLELATAGSNVTITENTTSNFSGGTLTGVTAASNSLMPTATNAIKYVGTQSIPGNGNSYAYWIIWTGSQSVGSSNSLDYDIWIDPSCPEIRAGVDLIFSDGSSLRDSATSANYDAQNMSPHPNTDLKGLADGKWYHRSFDISSFSGKTIGQCLVVFEGDSAGTYTAWFKNIAYKNTISHVIVTSFFASSLSTSQQGGVSGYSSLSVTVVPTYDLSSGSAKRVSSSYSLDAAKILRSSFLSWQGASPTGAQTTIRYTLDNWDGSYITCTNNAPLPDLPAGTSLAGRSITLSEEFGYAPSGMTPELAPSFTSVSLTVNTSYTGSKSDVTFPANSSTKWGQAGVTTSNVLTSSSILTLNGCVRSWDEGSIGSQTLFGNSSPSQIVTNKIFTLTASASNDARSRLDFAGTYSDFTLEVDLLLSSGPQIGIVYRTTHWENNSNTFAYAVMLTTTQIVLGRGTNSATQTFTNISTVSITLTSGNWHHLKIVASGSTHTIYLDNVQIINATDATFSAAGNVGLRNFNGTGTTQTVQFDNFGIIATSSMSGNWTSPSTSLTAAGTYGTSVISWKDESTNPSNSTLTVQTSINGGSTYQTCTNGAAIPGFTANQSLSGVSLLIKITMSTTTAVTLPGVDSLVAIVEGSLSSSGNRVSPALSLAPVGRAGATLVEWSGIQPANTLIGIDTSLDGSNWSQIGTGASGSGVIAGITTQSEPLIDTFNADTSLSYSSLYQTGGALATWTFDTTNSRLSASGGTNAVLLYNSSSVGSDLDIAFVSDTSDGGGLCWRYQNQSNYYDVAVHDASSVSNANTLRLFKVVAGTRTQIGSNTAITFTRGTPHVVRVNVVGSAITVYFDGVSKISTTDSSYTGSGFCGLRINGNSAYFYVFRLQFFGDDVTAKTVYSRVRLSTSDPTVTPQITQLSVSCRNANIQNGAFIPQTSYSLLNGNKNTIAQMIDDLAKQSNFWSRVLASQVYFQSHQATLAPFAVYKSDTLVSGIEVDTIADTYRNDQWISGGKDVISQTQSFVGDGTRTSFTLAYPVDSMTSITLVSGGSTVTQTIGVKNTDTGKQWYYAQGDNTIVQDTSGTPLLSSQVLTTAYNGQVDITANVRNDSEIARIAALDGTTGIISEAEDAGTLNKAGMITRANGLLTQFATTSKTLKFTTMRSGLAVGQLISVFVSPLGVVDGTFLITDIKTSWKSTVQNGASIIQPFYDVSAVSGPVVGDWTRFIANLATLGA